MRQPDPFNLQPHSCVFIDSRAEKQETLSRRRQLSDITTSRLTTFSSSTQTVVTNTYYQFSNI